MKTIRRNGAFFAAAAGVLAMSTLSAQAQEDEMSFFVTSQGLGNGAELGGLEGADEHCQQLAEAAGAGDREWAAYLSTQGDDAVDARDRIGSGPWYNANGDMIAEDVDALHEDDVNIDHETALDENGDHVPYVHLDDEGNAIAPPDQPEPVEHDILTGTQADGTAFPAGDDMTCDNWMSSSEDGSAMLGHHDRRSLQPGLSPWGAAHPSQGCSQENLVGTGGAGRFYCFATD